MARRWEKKHDKPMSPEELEAFRQTLRDKDHFALDREYTKAHDACKLVREVPPASYIQRLVTVWKVMRRGAGIRSR